MRTKFLILTFYFFLSQFSYSQIITIPYSDSGDNTADIEAAIASAPPGSTVLFTYQGVGNNWKSKPIILKSNITLEFEENVVLEADNDHISHYLDVDYAFDPNSKLFYIKDLENVNIIGNGATIKMDKSFFDSGEWAHTIAIYDSKSILIKDLILKESGGDGLYIGSYMNSQSSSGSLNITVDNVIFDGHARNGIGVIDVDSLNVKNCVFKNTGINNLGILAINGPFAGIDIEPNNTSQLARNIVIENSRFIKNKYRGLSISLKGDPNVSIDVNNNYIEGMDNDREGIILGEIKNDNYSGHVRFNNNTVYNTRKGLYIINVVDNSENSDNLDIEFNNTLFERAAKASDWSTIFFDITDSEISNNLGGITFKNTHLKNNTSSKLLTFKNNDQDGNPIAVGIGYQNIIFGNFYLDDSSPYNIDERAYVITDYSTPIEKELKHTRNPEIATGDFNNDGSTDFFLKNDDAFRGLYLAEAELVNEGKSFNNIFAGTVDGLGGTDSEPLFTSDNMKMYIGDYNGDGSSDIFMNGYYYGGNYFRVLYLATPNSIEPFNRVFFSKNIDIPILNSGNPKLFVGDFSGDGEFDEILVINTENSIKSALLVPNDNISIGAEGFTVYPNVINNDLFDRISGNELQIHTGDFNGDDKSDIFIKTETPSYRGLFFSEGTSFETILSTVSNNTELGLPHDLPFTSNQAKVYTGDFNGDGSADLFIKGYGLYKGLYLSDNSTTNFTFQENFMNDIDNSFGIDTELFFTSDDAKIYVGDYDGDGNSDLFVHGYNNYRQLYLANAPNNTFVDFKRVFKENQEEEGFVGINDNNYFLNGDIKIVIGDFNGDNATDFFAKTNNDFIATFFLNENKNGFNYFVSEENDLMSLDVHYNWNYDTTTSSARQQLEVEEYKSYKQTNILVYPNPAKDILNIEQIKDYNNLIIYDINGRLLIKEELINNKIDYKINIKSLSPGIYFINFISNESIYVKKFIKE